MAPKAKKQPNENLKQEHVLQAVVIADSFNVRFGPVTLKKPRALLPLVNIPLIEYTLEALAASQVQEVFVFCCHLGEQIRTYIKNSKWQNGNSSSMSVITLLSDSCISVGDALREIDAKSLIRSDFILVTGNLVANININEVVEEHKNRTQGKDKSSVMTLLFKTAQPGHRARCKEDEMFLLEEGHTKRLLYFQKSQDQRQFPIPKDILFDHEDVILHNDLMNCHVCVCSPIVPTLFTDNFDYQTVESFVKGILINEEIMGNKIHMSIIQDKYAARVSNLQSYDTISKDVICRWTKPLVPDMFGSCHERLKNGRHNVYCSEDVTLSRGSKLTNNVVVGGGTFIGSGTVISKSVIGRNCRIGENVKIENSYLFDNVTIEDKCHIDTSLLCSSVHILEDVVLGKGCVIAWETVVGPEVKLPCGTQLMSEPQKDEFDDLDNSFDEDGTLANGQKSKSEAEEKMDTASYGIECKAYLYKPQVESDDEDEEIVEDDSWWLAVSETRVDNSDVEGSEDSSVEDEEEDSNDEADAGGGGGDFVIDSDDEEGEEGAVDSSLGFNPKACLLKVDSAFYKELVATLVRAESEKIKEENLILEVNSLKHAFAVPINDVIHSLPSSFIDLAKKQKGGDGTSLPAVLATFKFLVTRYASVLSNYTKDSESQLTVIGGLGDYVIRNSEYRPRLPQLLNILYDSDILSEAAIMTWYNLSPSPSSSSKALCHAYLKKQAQAFITWLQTAESESSEEEEDDDDEEDNGN